MKARRILTAAGLAACATMVSAGTAMTHPADAATHHPSKTERQVVRSARADYSLPVDHAACWSTGHTTFSCQLFGPHGFRAIATGTVVGGHAEATFS